MQDANNSSSDIISTLRGMKTFSGDIPADFHHWFKKLSLVISIKRPDIFDIIEGCEKPESASPDATAAQKKKTEQLQEVFKKRKLFGWIFPRLPNSTGASCSRR